MVKKENDIMKKLTKKEKFQMLLEVAEVQANPVLVEL